VPVLCWGPAVGGMRCYPAVTIVINGEKRDVSEGLSAESLLAELDIGEGRVAVMINEEIIKKDQRSERCLAEGDQVEIIHMVGGG